MIAGVNSDRMIEAFLAACDAGAIATPVNWRWSPAELAAAVELTKPSVVLADAACWDLVHKAVQHAGASAHAQQPTAGVQSDLGASGATQEPSSSSSSQPASLPRTPMVILLGPAHSAQRAPQPSAPPPAAFSPQAPPLTTEQLIQQVAASSAVAPGMSLTPQLQLLQGPAAAILFTSGTTGRPKGVTLSHTALSSQSLAKLAVVGYSSTDTYLHLAPLFHIGGLSSALACIMAHASHVVLPKYDPRQALSEMRRHSVTAFIVVPTMLRDLAVAWSQQRTDAASQLQGGASQPEPLTCVSKVLLGAGATPPQLLDTAAAMFASATIMSAYGMTEAASSMTFLTLRSPSLPSRPSPSISPSHPHSSQHSASSSGGSGSSNGGAGPSSSGNGGTAVPCSGSGSVFEGATCVGWPAPGTAIRVVPLEPGTQPGSSGISGSGSAQQPTQAKPLQEGEVCTRGPHTLSHYWDNPQETAKVLSRHGWLRTGDVGFVDGRGALWLRGRAKDMVKSGGENVFAAEVEAALCAHPRVAAAAVVGLPDARMGEAVAALVVLRPPPPSAAAPTAAASPADEAGGGGSSAEGGVGGWQGPVVVASTDVGTGWGMQPTLAAAGRHHQQQQRCQPSAHQAATSVPQGFLTPEALTAFCRTAVGLTPFKLPRFIAALAPAPGPAPARSALLLPELPVNASGKVVKHLVREALAAAQRVWQPQPQQSHPQQAGGAGLRSRL